MAPRGGPAPDHAMQRGKMGGFIAQEDSMATERQSTFPPDYTGHVINTFRLIDDLLGRCVHSLDPEVLASPFSTHAADVTASRHAIVADHCQHIRDAMSSMLERQHIPAPVQTTSAARSARALVDEALVAAAGLNPRVSPGFAAMSAQQTEDACRIVDELMDQLSVLASDLGIRKNLIENSGEPRAEAVTGLGARLSDMRLVTGRHGLARPGACVDALSARIRSGNVTIGVFGDIGTGKSSLLNCILGSPLLPVSAMPATVVPVHIDYGVRESGSVEFADAISERFERGRLAEFAGAHANPQNQRHVTHIQFRTPAAILKRGVTLVDVPGASCIPGRLSRLDPALMFRCDLAVVLISAVASLALDEAQLLDELRHTGIDTMVLITKADLLAPEDRWRTYGHVVRELWEKTRCEVPVYLVSTKDTEAALCKAWQDGPLADYVTRYHERQARFLVARADWLGEQIVEALERRVERGIRSDPARVDAPALHATLDGMHAQLQRSRDEICAYEPASFLYRLVNEVAHNAAALWVEEKDSTFDVSRILELAATAHARNLATRASWRIEALRSQAAITLVQVANALEMPGSDFGCLPEMTDPPVFQPGNAFPETSIPCGLGSLFGRWGFYLSARRHLRRCPAIAALEFDLHDHVAAIHAWKVTALHSLLDSVGSQRARLVERIREISTVQICTGGNTEWTEQLQTDISRLREQIAQTPHPMSHSLEPSPESSGQSENHTRKSSQ